MPLVQFQLRNEYGLGKPELYKEVDREDPKAVLEGVAVAGLVGILRQLGDLAEFAAEVFHGLQEQVMITSSRSQKLMARTQNIEAALSPLEKAIWSQKSHLHFAYTSGTHWRARVKTEQNLFIYDDLPQFVMDSYEECSRPPRLQLLDRFDAGGPGSCLKRYSDPTFFRRASGISSEINMGQASKYRKAHRRKYKKEKLTLQKKRAWKTNGEVSNIGPSTRDQYARNKFGPHYVDEQLSSRNISTFDFIKSSELEDQTNSFNSRFGSGYIECVFQPTYTLNPEEQGSVEPSISGVEIQNSDMLDSTSLEEQILAADDYFEEHNSMENAGPRSSCVTWDEKTEITETENLCIPDEAMDMLSTKFNVETQDSELSHLVNKYETDLPFHDGEDEKGPTLARVNQPDNIESDAHENQPNNIESEPKNYAHVNQPDDIESEPDNYVDALNTIESESEADLDCQTKQELELEVTTHNGLNSESGSTSHPSTNKEISADISKPNSLDTLILESPHKEDMHEKNMLDDQDVEVADQDKMSSPPLSGGLILDSSSEIENLQADYSNVKFIPSRLDLSSLNSRELDLQASVHDKILSNSNEPQQLPEKITSTQSVQFWTNGGLLGLEPSKPPVFSGLNPEVQCSTTQDKDNSPGQEVVGPSNRFSKQHKPVKISEIIQQDYSSNDDETVLNNTFQRFSPTSLDNNSKIFGYANERTKLVHITDTGGFPTDSSQRNGENAQQTVGLANKLFPNSFQKKVLSLRDAKFDVRTNTKIGLPELKSNHHGKNLNCLSRNGSLENSPPSSPPIQHMKISFQPLAGFDISNLKLKFPDVNQLHNNGGDILPSFQLVPEPGTRHSDISLDSDDDTFCRSSPYNSDDCNSHHSDESNSEQWVSDTTSQSKDNELYHALQRISLTESISTSQDSETGDARLQPKKEDELKNSNVEHHEENLQFIPSFDLLSFDNLNPLFELDMKNGNSESIMEPSPLPPPLPPLEWRVMRTNTSMGKVDPAAEVPDYADEMTLSLGTANVPTKPLPVQLQLDDHPILKTDMAQFQKLKERKESNHIANFRGTNEQDDFLEQIRNKSFNLRRTATTSNNTVKPALSPTTSKVNAILEKANAIRQAVGSDDDDTWSEV